MKIYIPRSEAIAALRSHFVLPQNAEIHIGKPVKHRRTSAININETPQFLLDVSSKTHGFGHGQNSWQYIRGIMPHNKIGAIKELRSLAGYGLKEAKDAVEHWHIFAPLVHIKNDWPRVKGEEFGVTTFE